MTQDKPELAGIELRCGVYEHYKGDHYLVLGVARDDRDDSPLVIYSRLYRRAGVPISARPLAQFLEDVDLGGKPVARFRYLGLLDPG